MKINNIDLVVLANKALPSYGSFGKGEGLNLLIEVGAIVDRIVIYIASPLDSILNIHPPKIFLDGGAELDLLSDLVSLQMSSMLNDAPVDKVREIIKSGGLLHSNKERFPSIIISLKKPMPIKALQVINRDGIYGYRSKDLRVAFFKGNICVNEYYNGSPERLVSEFVSLCARMGVILPEEKEDLYPADILLEIHQRLISASEKGRLRLSFKKICQLLPNSLPPDRVGEYEITLCASAILSALGEKRYTSTKALSALAGIMSTGDIIDRVQNKCNEIIIKKNGTTDKLTFSKHQIHYSRLHAHKDKFLSALDKLFDIFSKINVPLVLSYGTLLGAVREKSFLEHDDDVDLLYWDGSKSKSEMMSGQVKLISSLRDYGVKIYEDPKGMNFHINVDGTNLDIFPSWIENDKLFLLMEQMKYRPINKDICFGGENPKATLHGKDYPAPTAPKDFLRERYGEGWVSPDKFYGWPWKVSN